MYRTLFVTINLLLSSQIIIAGQNDPWDNTLEAVLFVSSQTDLDGDGTTGVGDLLLVIEELGNIADPAGIQTDEGLMIFKTVLYN
jgi:hypothetical protein